jgi:hypothetical protein
MDLYETITAHHDAMRLPMYAVTVATAARVDSPVLLILHWHGFRRETPLRVQGVMPPARPVPGSALQIDEHWHSLADLEQSMLEAAWQLGAWDVERVIRPAWRRLGAPAGEALACRRAFGDYPDAEPGSETVLAAAPDRDAMIDAAARRGYIRWMFRPRRAGVWAQLDDDDSTLDVAGGRRLPCPVSPRPWRGEENSRTVYRLGRAAHLIFPDTY